MLVEGIEGKGYEVVPIDIDESVRISNIFEEVKRKSRALNKIKESDCVFRRLITPRELGDNAPKAFYQMCTESRNLLKMEPTDIVKEHFPGRPEKKRVHAGGGEGLRILIWHLKP